MARARVRKAAGSPQSDAVIHPEDVSPSVAPYLELGIGGIARYGAISRVYEEFLRELQGPQGMKLYREQIDNCPITGGFLYAAQHLARQTDWRVDPAKGAGIDDQLAGKVAERVKGALFDDLETTWPDTLSEILTMLGFGWSCLELTYKRCQGPEPPHEGQAGAQPASGLEALVPKPLSAVTGGLTGTGQEPDPFVPSKFNDGWLGWRSWGLRAQETLFMWEWDATSRATVLQQMAPPDFRIRRIPLAKCLHFKTQVAKHNPEGRSLLRNSITSYLYRKNLQMIEGIGVERDLAGYPVFQVKEPDPAKNLMPPDLWNPKDTNAVALLAKVQALVRGVRRDEQEGMVLPWWLDFKLVNAGGSRQLDTNAIIARYDQRIAMSVLADFILLGHEAVGSKALASTKSELFTTALATFLDIICAEINRHAIPQLLALNGIPPILAPTLVHGDVSQMPLEALGRYIFYLAKAGMPLFPDPDLEEAIRQAAKLPTTGVQSRAEALSYETGGLEAPTGEASEGDTEAAPAESPAAIPGLRQTPGPE